VVCADDADRARWLHGSSRLSMLRLRSGAPSTLPSPEEAEAHERTVSASERALVVQTTWSHVVGDPASVKHQLTELAERTGVDEMFVTTNVFHQADRLRSYELVAHSMGASGGLRTAVDALGNT
jgi:alkanesulfonate monooxygenase SsuD/methylene tetrahydromethanopterin reductase-like flavin-dependent oxidoreductase (luciferase family)